MEEKRYLHERFKGRIFEFWSFLLAKATDLSVFSFRSETRHAVKTKEIFFSCLIFILFVCFFLSFSNHKIMKRERGKWNGWQKTDIKKINKDNYGRSLTLTRVEYSSFDTT